MKPRIGTTQRLQEWLAQPLPAVFQDLDLVPHSAAVASVSLKGCSFLGCQLDDDFLRKAAADGCLVIPKPPGLPFDPFTPGHYTPAELYDRFDPDRPESYHECLDKRVYDSVMDAATKEPLPVDPDVFLLRRLHDASISEAMGEFLDLSNRQRSVAVMGGHDVPRDSAVYAAIAELGQHLALSGFLVLTGGGPGLMEAANLGAYTAGFDDPPAVLHDALEALKAAPVFRHKDWLATAFRIWKAMGPPPMPSKNRNLGIPTWFYGHEPPNVFATDIAKYFENSVREEGLLAVALGGVIYAEGNAGTVQEIFEDACQNYYRTFDKCKSPMILLGRDYWTRQKPAFALLKQLAEEKDFADYILVTDDLAEVVPFLRAHPPAA